jgi:hypothetical protein
LKAVDKLLPLHTAQILTYLKLSARPVGLLINFNVVHLRDRIRRVVNGYPVPTEKSLPSVSSVSSVVESSVEETFPDARESNAKEAKGG